MTKDYGSIRGRLGVALDRFLVFGTGGWATGNPSTAFALTGAAQFVTTGRKSYGWTVGAGIEYAITDTILAEPPTARSPSVTEVQTIGALLPHSVRIGNSRFHKTGVLTGPMSDAHDAAAQIDKVLDEPRKCAKAWRSIRYDGARSRSLPLMRSRYRVRSRAASPHAPRPELVAQSGGILCHTDEAGQAAPASDKDNNTICADCRCVGCLTLMAGISLPQARIIVVGKLSSQVIALLATSVVAGSPSAKSHQSRAPPREAA